jgi:hypothetical protein
MTSLLFNKCLFHKVNCKKRFAIYPRRFAVTPAEIPDDIRGVIYCDPNLAKKGKGDTTAIVKLGTDGEYLYVKEVYVKNTTKGIDLIEQILLMQEWDFRDIGFDGNYGQVRNEFCFEKQNAKGVLQKKRPPSLGLQAGTTDGH